MTEPLPQESPSPANGRLRWHSRYGGAAVTAMLDDKAVAGISGPWSNQFALTWWDRPQPQRRLELFDSLHEAQQAVENWAQRLGAGYHALATVRAAAEPTPPRPSLMQRVRAMLAQVTLDADDLHHGAIERQRDRHDHLNLDLHGIHLVAER